jgi:hypothetical protein
MSLDSETLGITLARASLASLERNHREHRFTILSLDRHGKELAGILRMIAETKGVRDNDTIRDGEVHLSDSF